MSRNLEDELYKFEEWARSLSRKDRMKEAINILLEMGSISEKGAQEDLKKLEQEYGGEIDGR